MQVQRFVDWKRHGITPVPLFSAGKPSGYRRNGRVGFRPFLQNGFVIATWTSRVSSRCLSIACCTTRRCSAWRALPPMPKCSTTSACSSGRTAASSRARRGRGDGQAGGDRAARGNQGATGVLRASLLKQMRFWPSCTICNGPRRGARGAVSVQRRATPCNQRATGVLRTNLLKKLSFLARCSSCTGIAAVAQGAVGPRAAVRPTGSGAAGAQGATIRRRRWRSRTAGERRSHGRLPPSFSVVVLI